MSDMMAENKERKGLERDISMCGKSIVWFSVRLAYLSEQIVKNDHGDVEISFSKQ